MYVYVTMEKEMASHSSTLAWKIPWMEEPGKLQSWDYRVAHNWATSLHQWGRGGVLVGLVQVGYLSSSLLCWVQAQSRYIWCTTAILDWGLFSDASTHSPPTWRVAAAVSHKELWSEEPSSRPLHEIPFVTEKLNTKEKYVGLYYLDSLFLFLRNSLWALLETVLLLEWKLVFRLLPQTL